MSTKYRALLLDLDGTTLGNGESSASPRVSGAIQELISRQIPVCFVTGRSLAKSIDMFEQVGVQHACMLSNGAVIYDPLRRQIVEEHVMSVKLAQQVLDALQVETSRVMYHTVLEELDYDQETFNQPLAGLYIRDFMTLAAAEQAQKTVQMIASLQAYVVTNTFSGLPALVVSHAQATKQQALLYLFRSLKIPPEEIVAVGDGENDLPMLLAAGLGVAMGNAPSTIQAAADAVTVPVELDGVAEVIQTYF